MWQSSQAFSASALRSCRVLGSEDWAVSNGFEVKRFIPPLEQSRKLYLDQGIIPAWKDKAIAYASSPRPDSLMAIMASQATITGFGWPNSDYEEGRPKKRDDQQFNILSQSSDLMSDDTYWFQFIANKVAFRCLSPDRSRFLIDFSGARGRSPRCPRKAR